MVREMIFWKRVLLIGSVALLSLCAFALRPEEPLPATREIAITFDDLPKVMPLPVRSENTNQAYLALSRMIAVMQQHHASATGFVIGTNLEASDHSARLAMLRMWVKSGMSLGNHSYSHPNLCEDVENTYGEDVLRGDAALAKVGDLGTPAKYFRFPYLCTGKDRAAKEAFAAFLVKHGMRNAPATVIPGDYLFNELYLAARTRNDAALQKRIRDEYLSHLDVLLSYCEGVSRQLFGREIRQVLLIHSNDLNADCLDDVLKVIERRGYRFVPLDRALEDPAYNTPDDYIGAMGISWLHRWKVAMGKPFDYQSEPGIPEWIVSKVAKLHQVR
jgi:peptidoglycan/xylan/chitin deacetylase (PgdA/CDA1 family)